MNIDAGELNKKIQIFEKTETRDSAGFVTATTLTAVRSTWASFKRQSIKESTQAGGDFGTVRARFVVRTTAVEISRHMIILYAGEAYEIESVNDYGDNREYTEIGAVLTTLGG